MRIAAKLHYLLRIFHTWDYKGSRFRFFDWICRDWADHSGHGQIVVASSYFLVGLSLVFCETIPSSNLGLNLESQGGKR